MIVLIAATLVGGVAGGLALGLPGLFTGATVGVMLASIFLLNRE